MKKQNKRNQFTRIALALLLILSMLGNTLIFPTVAQETVAPVDNTPSSETPSADEATTDTTATPTLPEPILLTAADIPEFISAAALTERGAVERMRSEETNMSSVIFRNSDGTRTMYMYGLPVKYTAADGTVRDKSTNFVSVSTASVLLSDQPVAQTMAQMSTTQRAALQEELGILDAERAATTLHMLSTALATRQRSLSDMAYTTLDNDVYALFPTNLAKGMTLVFGEHSVRMTPAGTGMTVTAGGNVTKTTTSSLSDADVAERLLYPNVFGLGTAVQYTPTLTGVKEEILLSRNVGKNSFAFLLETGGLVLTEQNGQFVLIDPETEQQVGKLGEIIVFDSAGRIVRGNMTAQTILAGQKYGITISVDQEFLASATYPVSIDPTISTVKDIKSRTIEDMGVYNHEDAWGSTFNEFPYVGKTAIDDYTGVLLYRFPFIYNSSLLPFDNEDNNTEEHENHKNDVLTTAAQIGSAKLTITVAYSSQYPITLGVKQSSISWSTNGMRICDADTYTAAISGTNILSSTDVINSTGTVELDVTEIMRAWFNYENGITHGTSLDPEKGFVLFSNNPAVRTQIGGVTGYTDSDKPLLTIDYITEEQVGPYYINNKQSNQFLLCTDPFTMSLQAGRVADLGTDMEWMLYYMGGSNYALTPADHEGISFINSEGTLSIAGAAPEPYCRWTMITDWTDFAFRNVQVTDRVFSYIYNVEYSTYSIGYTTISTSVTDINNSAITDYSKWRLILKSEYVEFPNLTLTHITLSPDEPTNMYEYLNADNYALSSFGDLNIYGYDAAVATVSYGIITPLQVGKSLTIRVRHFPTDSSKYITVDIGFSDQIVHTLKNKTQGKLLIPVNSDNYSFIEIEPYDENNTTCMWKFEYAGDYGYEDCEYYKIRNDVTGYYLTAPRNNAENAKITQELFVSEYSLWKIENTSDGYCTIQSKNQYQRTTATPLFLTINGEDVVQSSDTTNYKWDVRELTLNLSLYYDQAFADAYNVVGVTPVDAIKNIVTNNTTGLANHRNVKQFFKDEFGIKVNITILSTVYESFPYSRNCSNKNNPTASCACYSFVEDGDIEDCKNGYHHKSANNFLGSLPASDTTINILFTGHRTDCNHWDETHTEERLYGLAEGIGSGTRCVIFAKEFDFYEGTSITTYNDIKLTLAHEILHLLSVSHHYSTEPHNCIHGSNRHTPTVYGEILICDRCVGMVDSIKLKRLYEHNQ